MWEGLLAMFVSSRTLLEPPECWRLTVRSVSYREGRWGSLMPLKESCPEVGLKARVVALCDTTFCSCMKCLGIENVQAPLDCWERSDLLLQNVVEPCSAF